jgi:hypothetical protein
MLFAMFRAAKYASYFGLMVAALLLSPNTPGAEDRYSENTALLAISVHKQRVTAGMMCVDSETGSVDDTGNPPKCEKFEIPDSNMCRPRSLGILNPNVLAFNVTFWPRRAIAELASRLQQMADPLNYDFSPARLAGLQVRRIEENEDEERSSSTFEFRSGCYLLVIIPGSTPAPES